MKSSAALKFVPAISPKPQPYSEAKGIVRIGVMRRQLLQAVVKYVVEGKSGHIKDRVREASAMSGIPTNLIETMLPRK